MWTRNIDFGFPFLEHHCKKGTEPQTNTVNFDKRTPLKAVGHEFPLNSDVRHVGSLTLDTHTVDKSRFAAIGMDKTLSKLSTVVPAELITMQSWRHKRLKPTS